ncbi:MAG TPA: zinc-binding dehydrogenase, partial [Bauldia sp.]|nr:zinc-binding dehydrogenase [Bauldia sp.]
GGIGTAMLDVLRIAGARAFGAASAKHHNLVRSYGATPVESRSEAIDVGVRRIEPNGVDVTLDNLGGRFAGQNIRATRSGGVIVGIGFAGTNNGLMSVPISLGRLFSAAYLNGRRAKFFGITQFYRKDPHPFRMDLATLFALAAAGRIKPLIAARLPLLAAREAAEMMESGAVQGKIVHLADSAYTAPG